MTTQQQEIFIDDADTETMIRLLAGQRGLSAEEAVMLAVSNELARMDAEAAE